MLQYLRENVETSYSNKSNQVYYITCKII